MRSRNRKRGHTYRRDAPACSADTRESHSFRFINFGNMTQNMPDCSGELTAHETGCCLYLNWSFVKCLPLEMFKQVFSLLLDFFTRWMHRVCAHFYMSEDYREDKKKKHSCHEIQEVFNRLEAVFSQLACRHISCAQHKYFCWHP